MKIKKALKELEAIRGRHTELVTVYVPADYNIQEMINQLSQEKSTAENIKSKATRNNVLDALDKIIQHLRFFRKTPPNGLVAFAGNASETEGRSDIRLWAFEPPEKMRTKLYWCDQTFVLDPLKDLIREREIYGLIVLDAREANIGILKGKEIIQLKHMDSTVPGKTIKGGMCLHESTVVNNGKMNDIKHVKEGDNILSFDFKSRSFRFSRIEAVKKRKAAVSYRITTDDGHELTATPEHLLFVKRLLSVEEKTAEDILIGDSLLSMDFGDTKKLKKTNVVGKDRIKNTGNFFDLSVPGTENFLANGLLVHNSQMRYDRIRDDALNEFFRKVADMATQVLLEMPDLKGVIIGGPGPNKELFFKNEYLNYQIQKKVLGIKDVGYTGQEGLKELVERSEDLIKESKYMHERELLKRFFTELQKSGNVAYGYENVRKALDLGAVDMMLMSESFKMSRIKFRCQCGHSAVKDLVTNDKKQLCDNCKSEMGIEEEVDMTDILLKDASAFGTKVELVSVDTEEGRQFSKIGGLGALLRYKIS